jgi:uncharacterized membrane protein
MMPITKNRMEAFSDGVIAILITIMVLGLRPPEQASLEALKPLLPIFFSYVLSFVYLAIYWNNHHHMLHTVQHINGRIMWANLHLLFWLSLFPFTSAWVGQTHSAPWPTALYGTILFMAALAYLILQKSIIVSQGEGSVLSKAVGNTWKEKVSPACYFAAIACALVAPWISNVLYVLVALLWIVPDKRIERLVQ